MRKLFIKTIAGNLVFLFTTFQVNGQSIVETLNTIKDSYVTSQLPAQNFGSDDYLNAGTVQPRFMSPYYRRTFVEFDLSNIQPNAVIISANIKLKIYNGINGTNPFRTKLVTSSWSESLITLNNQPTISNDAADISSTYSETNGIVSFDVKEMAQRMVNGQVSNNGWSIQVLDETSQSLTGATFYSKESTVYTPVLEIEYYYPISLTNVVVSHESSAGANDGSISVSLSNGSGTFTYNWVNGATGASIGSSSSVSGLSYGWYGLHVTGIYGEEFYYAFLIGTECEEVTISFKTHKNYTDNAYIYNLNAGGLDRGDLNYGDYAYIRANRWDYYYSPTTYWYSGKSLLKFNLWMDASLIVNQANLTINGAAHTSGIGNESEFNLITQQWHQNLVTWNNQPASSSTVDVNVPSTTSSTQNNIVDISAFWDEWKLDNFQNFGMIFQLINNSNYRHEQRYYSPASTLLNSQPVIEFKLFIDNPLSYTCNPNLLPYNELKRSLDGGQALVYNGILKFKYQEEYAVDSDEYLEYNIYDEARNVVASSNRSGGTTGGVSPLHYNFDDNRYELYIGSIPGITPNKYYILEVFTSKGQKKYLKVLFKS